MSWKVIPRLRWVRQYTLSQGGKVSLSRGGKVMASFVRGSGKSFTKEVERIVKEFNENISFGVVFPPELTFLIYHEFGTATYVDAAGAEKAGFGYLEESGGDLYEIWPTHGEKLRWYDPDFRYPQLHNKPEEEGGSGREQDDFAWAYAVVHAGVKPTRWLSTILPQINLVVKGAALRLMFDYPEHVCDRDFIKKYFLEEVAPEVIEIMVGSIEANLPGTSLEERGGDIEGTKLGGMSAADYFRQYVKFSLK